MNQILLIGKAVFFTTLILQMGYLTKRYLLKEAGSLWLLLNYALWGARLVFLPSSFLRMLFVLLFLLATGSYIYHLEGKRNSVVWMSAGIGFAIALGLAAALGYSPNISFKLFVLLCVCIVSFFPGYLLCDSLRKGFSGRPLLSIFGMVVWLSVICVIYVFPKETRANDMDWDLWISALTLGAVFFMSVGAESMNSRHQRTSSSQMRERNLLGALARLDQNETVMLLQQRVISTGFLTASLIHEFKNVMTYIDACSEFALGQTDPEQVNRCLKTVRENVSRGSRTVISLLNTLAQGRREELSVIPIREFLAEFVRSIRINYRMEEIRFCLNVAVDRTVALRRGELEQVLFNLIHNSVQAFKNMDGDLYRRIEIACHVTEPSMVIELRDNAGGLSEHAQKKLFAPPTEISPSGLGLYLAHILVIQNGGTLEFQPLVDGSCFRIAYPI